MFANKLSSAERIRVRELWPRLFLVQESDSWLQFRALIRNAFGRECRARPFLFGLVNDMVQETIRRVLSWRRGHDVDQVTDLRDPAFLVSVLFHRTWRKTLKTRLIVPGAVVLEAAQQVEAPPIIDAEAIARALRRTIALANLSPRDRRTLKRVRLDLVPPDPSRRTGRVQLGRVLARLRVVAERLRDSPDFVDVLPDWLFDGRR